MIKKNKNKKTVVYINEEDYRKLRVKLLLEKKTVSGWFRDKVKEYLQNSS